MASRRCVAPGQRRSVDRVHGNLLAPAPTRPPATRRVFTRNQLPE